MTIRTRLLIAFSILVAMVVVMGAALVSFGLQNRRLSEKTMYYYSRLFLLREIDQAFDSQWRNLNYYVVLADDREKENFTLQIDNINQKAKEIAPPREDFDRWYNSYRELNDIAEKGIKSKSREHLFEIFSTDLARRNQSLRTELKGLILHHTTQLTELERQIKKLNIFNLGFSIALGLLAIIIGVLMGVVIYRSIFRPLSLLQQGARIIGEGKLDYQIPINTNDEIGKLAQSFNQMVNDLRTLQLQIIQMDRMSSIGQLAGGVAHEINNPLTGVLGQAQLLLEKLPKEHPFRGSVERIESAAQRCRRIVRALLDFAREKNYNFRPTDLGKLIDESLDFTKTEMDSRGVRLNKNYVTIPPVKASFGHIQQVFLNIITNAIQAMPKGGTLTIEAEVKDRTVEILFSDTGIGIRKDDLNHVFDPFFTTKEVGQGTGLGLTISYGIIQRHQGEILVRSEGENKGTTVVVRLPLNDSING